ncbi:phospholipase C [Rhodococcus sp. LBL1]|nr:phospholipase C [Rhodococcus sp. LBL1]MDH6682516.1 phospholipase C [Rhodococcus sp. LBL2]
MTFEMSRRRFMTIGAGALGVAAVGSLLPPSLQAALASPVPPGGLDSIEHVVLLMQENRAFDHYFGTLRGVRGFGDPNALTLRTGRTVYEQPDRESVVVPYPIREAARAQRMDKENVDSLDHGWVTGQASVAGGWHDGWIPAKTAATMAHYDRQDIPFQFELAESFTVCDAYHCSVPTSTSPNCNYWFTGYTGFEPDGSRVVTNDAYMPWHPGYTWTTVAERLEAAGVSWRAYQEWDNFTDNNLEYFVRFKQVVHALLGHPVLVPYQFTTLAAFYAALPMLPPNIQNALLRALDEGAARLDGPDRRLYDRALRRERPGTLADAFRADIRAGTLPQVSYIVPSAADSEHPMESSPAASATLVYKILDAVASDPETWSKTAIFLNFDENDGYYDHVPPPLPPRDVVDEYVGDKPLGLGPRVPMTVVSPWTVGGYVCSQVFDHTSVTRFLENRFGFTQPEISGWRRTVAGDLTSAFDFTTPRARPQLTQPPPAPPLTPRWKPAPPEQQRMPVQESGTRPARALPYQPDADVSFDAAARELSVRLRNSGAESAHLALYPYAREFELPRHYDVLGDQADTVPVPGERYDLTMLGPNGFRREFAGSTTGPGAAVHVGTAVHAASRTVRVTVANRGAGAVTAELAGDSASLAAGTERTWTVSSQHGWYDASLALDEDPSFRRRWMGHVENGSESVSQPSVVVAATGDLTLLPQPPQPTGTGSLPLPPGSHGS